MIVARSGVPCGAISEPTITTTIGKRIFARLFFFSGQQSHDWRLHQGHERHVRISGDGDRPQQLGRIATRHVNRRRSVHRADHADGDRLQGRETEQKREEQRDEDAKLSGCAEQQNSGVLQ
jgi:hypothetical protein